jgi:serine/threonine-protein kinase
LYQKASKAYLGQLRMLLHPGNRPVPGYPDYKLIRKLGAGAFGEVWHAHGLGGLDVALKFIHLEAHLLAIELRSLEVMKTIRHPNLVSLFGAWHKDNWLILAMELCDRTLHDRLQEALDQKLPGIPLTELLSYMSDAANGLDALNAKQVQHRDVKPANLLLLGSGVKVADFGLAKALEQTIATNSGGGTIAYLAPECFKGSLTQQSDQYSLAVTYYHLRTGQMLFKGDQAQVMYAHLELEPGLSELPSGEGVVLKRALSKEPGKRWPNCKEFVKELIATAKPRVLPLRLAISVPGTLYFRPEDFTPTSGDRHRWLAGWQRMADTPTVVEVNGDLHKDLFSRAFPHCQFESEYQFASDAKTDDHSDGILRLHAAIPLRSLRLQQNNLSDTSYLQHLRGLEYLALKLPRYTKGTRM